MPTLKEKADHLSVKRGELAAKFAEIRDDATGEFKAITPAQQKEIVDRNNELSTLQDEYDSMKAVDEAYQSNIAELKALREPDRRFGFSGHPKGGPEEPGTRLTLGQSLTETKDYKDRLSLKDGFTKSSFRGGQMTVEADKISVKTLFQTSAGFAPFVPRDNTIIYTPQRRLVVADLIPQEDTTVPGVRYMEETLFTNNAAAVAEGATKPESALQYTERFLGMTKIATTLPVTEEQMSDVPQMRSIIDNRLGLMLGLEEERELLQGSGTTPEMTGYINKSGVQTQAKGSSDDFTAILTGIVKVENTVGFANVTGIVMHPLDWLAIRTKQDSTGRFIMGNPDDPGMDRLWGKPVVPTIAEPQGTILLGDFQTFSQILRREGVTFRIGLVNDQLLKNELTIVIEERLVLVIYRASAYCLVTGTF